MSKFELKLPKMGESVAEATLTAWLKDIGDTIEFDEAVVEIATDKVDSEVPSEKKGVLIEKCFEVNDVIEVGQTIAIIETGEIEISAETNTKNNIQEENTKSTEDKNISEKEQYYFVHSYALDNKNSNEILANTTYNQKIPAIIGRDNYIGVQFHPEKSGNSGQKFIYNWLKWIP